MSNIDVLITDRVIGRTSISGPEGSLTELKQSVDDAVTVNSSNTAQIALNTGKIAVNTDSIASLAAFIAPTVTEAVHINPELQSDPAIGKIIYIPFTGIPGTQGELYVFDGLDYKKLPASSNYIDGSPVVIEGPPGQ